MSTIKTLPYKHKADFAGVFCAADIRARIDQFARPYFRLRLVDPTGNIRAYWWKQEHYNGIKESALVEVHGRIRDFSGQWIADILELAPYEPATRDGNDVIAQLPRARCPKPEYLDRLGTIVKSLEADALRQFVYQVFEDLDIALPFLSATASREHHHSEPGGLIAHSVECAELIQKLYPTPSEDRDLAIVGALFHDIGKIRTRQPHGAHSSLAYLISHDALTLEILAAPLHMLEKQWYDAAVALRYIWTWQQSPRRPQYPVIVSAEVVRAVDRMSVLVDVHNRAFLDAPEWKRFSNFGNMGKSIRCWRQHSPENVDRGR